MKLRLFGLGAVLVLAMCIGASPAAASKYRLGAESASLEGVATNQHRFFTGLGELNCEEPPFSATILDEDAIIRPSMADVKCGSAEVKYNGCAFTFRPGREIAAGKWQGATGIGNAPGKSCTTGITIAKWPLGSCTITIPPDDVINEPEVTFEEVKGPPKTLKINFNVDLTAHSTSECGGSTFALPYEGKWAVSAKSGGLSTNLYVENPPKWGEPSGPLDTFEIEFLESGSQVLAGQSEQLSFETGAGTVYCANAFEGAMSGPTTTLTVDGLQSNCSVTNALEEEFEAEVNMNGCQYKLSAAGTMDIVCPAEKSIEIKALTSKAEWCVYKVAAQSGVESIKYTNIGSGFNQSIETKFTNAGKSVELKRVSGKLFNCGAANQASHHGGVVVLEAQGPAGDQFGLRIG